MRSDPTARQRQRAALAILLLAAAFSPQAAYATPVEVLFSGTIGDARAGGPVEPGDPFLGFVRYELSEPWSRPAPPDSMVFTDGTALLSVVTGGGTYGTDLADPEVGLVWDWFWFNNITGESRPADDPPADPEDWVLVDVMRIDSLRNVEVGGLTYQLGLRFTAGGNPLDYTFPDTSQRLAQLLESNAAFQVADASGFLFGGDIAQAIPEPSTALLVVGGLLVLAVRRRVWSGVAGLRT